MHFFFYGTLIDPDIRRLLLGPHYENLQFAPADLLGYRRVRAKSGDFPVLVRQTGRRLGGLLVDNLPPQNLLSIAHFEGPDYCLRQAPAIDTAGRRWQPWLFMPRFPRVASRRPWNFELWQKHGKARLMPDLERWMGEFGALTLQSIDTPWQVKRQIHALCREADKIPPPQCG